MTKQCRLSGRNSRLIYAIVYKNTASECIKLCSAVKYKAAIVRGTKNNSCKRSITIARQGARRKWCGINFLRKQSHYFRFLSLNLFLWRHFEMSSDLLFRRDFWSACRITSFSAKQSGHFLAPFRYGMAR